MPGPSIPISLDTYIEGKSGTNPGQSHPHAKASKPRGGASHGERKGDRQTPQRTKLVIHPMAPRAPRGTMMGPRGTPISPRLPWKKRGKCPISQKKNLRQEKSRTRKYHNKIPATRLIALGTYLPAWRLAAPDKLGPQESDPSPWLREIGSLPQRAPTSSGPSSRRGPWTGPGLGEKTSTGKCKSRWHP